MKKISLLLWLVFVTTSLFAQETIAVHIYSTTPLRESTNPLCSRIVTALLNSIDNRYIVVERSAEIGKILRDEFAYGETGLVKDSDLIQAGNQLGANKVCVVVITDSGTKDGYFFECKILDVKDNAVERQAEYPRIGTDDSYIHDLSIASSQKVATAFAEQLNLLPPSKPKPTICDRIHCTMATPGGSLLSSAIIPGLGLVNKGYTGWGVALFVVELGSMSGCIATYCKAQELLLILKDPDVTIDVFKVTESQYKSLKWKNNVFLGLTATVYTVNLITSLVSKDKQSDRCAFNASFIEMDSELIPALSLTLNF